MEPGMSELEEKRLRRKAKNKAKKEESKRAREEEVRRKLYAPKTQKVLVMNHERAGTFPWSNVRPDSVAPAPPVAVTPADFPDLGSGRRRPRPEKKTSPGAENRRPSPPAGREAAGDGPSSDPRCEDDGGASDTERAADQGGDKNATAKRRRGDPIKIDLLAALRKPPAPAEEKPPPAGPKKKTPLQLSGNQLDASRPERMKGKRRENPKPQKPTLLKSVILRDREARKALKGRSQDGQEEKANVESVVPRAAPVPPRSCADDQTSGTESVSEVETPGGPGGPAPTPGDRGVPKGRRDGDADREGEAGNEVVGSHEIVSTMSRLRIDENRASGSVHNSKFRDYCDHVPSSELDAAVRALLTDIVRFQDRLYFADPVRAHAKRRFVLGFRETGKYLSLKRLKLVVVAPDLEAARSEGGIDDAVAGLRELSRSQGVPCVFSLGRNVLRRLTHKSCMVKGISCVGVMNYEGSQENYHTIQSLLPELRSRYRCLTKTGGSPSATNPVPATETSQPEEDSFDINKQVVATFLMKLTKELETK